MTAKDFRIGNFIQITVSGEERICSVVAVNKDSISFEEIKGKGVWHGASPMRKSIPLTEEWLLKFGFIQMPETSWLGNGYDYQRESSGTSQRDFIKDRIIFRFQTWYWTDGKGERHEEDSTHLLLGNESWYHKINEGHVPCGEIHWVHELQNIVYVLRGEELEIINTQK